MLFGVFGHEEKCSRKQKSPSGLLALRGLFPSLLSPPQSRSRSRLPCRRGIRPTSGRPVSVMRSTTVPGWSSQLLLGKFVSAETAKFSDRDGSNARVFSALFGYYLLMSKVTKTLVIIVVAIAVAGGAGLFLATRSSTPAVSEAAVVPTGGGHFLGTENAPVTLMEFGDYQCPSCGAYFPVVNEVMKRYPTQVRLEFHHYPLVNLHPSAMAAALAAEAAADQNKFWEMHDLIFENQATWSKLQNAEAEFVTYAGRLGLDINKLMQSKRSPDVQQRVLADVTRAREAKLNSVPTFFINGKQIVTPNGVDEFSAVIQSNLPK